MTAVKVVWLQLWLNAAYCELGAKVRLDQTMSARELLYGESHSRIVVSTKQENLDRLQALADQHGVPWELLGHVKTMS